MRILGIDPGTARVGWGIVDITNSKLSPIAYGLIATKLNTPLEVKLRAIYDQLDTIINKFHPETLAIEDIFFSTNAKTAFSVGQARGVLLLCAQKNTLSIFSYNPLTVKKTICGTGAATKDQMGKMMVQLLHLEALPKPDDVVDALALAACHGYSYKLKQTLS